MEPNPMTPLSGKRLAVTLRLALAASLLAVAGCAGKPVVDFSRIYHDRWPDFLTGAPGTAFRIDIAGTPFPGKQAATDAVVIEAMNKGLNNAAYTFSADAVPQDEVTPRLAVLLNGATVAPADLCGELAGLVSRTPPASASGVRLQAALCRGTSPLTTARGVVSDVTAPDNPAFRSLANQVALQLFRYQPVVDPRRRQPDVQE